MNVLTAVLVGVIVFLIGQTLQQFVLERIKEFNTQRADTFYYLVRVRDAKWDADEKRDIRHMRSALIYSVELVPFYNVLAAMWVFGLPQKENVRKAADLVQKIADQVNSSSKTAEVDSLATTASRLLGIKAAL